MRAIRVNQQADEPGLVVHELPDPRPGPGQVLITVAAAGVNRADLMQRDGHYPPPPGAPDTPGLEVSGTVRSTGEGVTRFREGDRVCALLAGGGYAELAVADEACVFPIPDGMDVLTAAAVPEVACTVWANLVMTAGLRPGERLLVHGGSSGIGTAAIQVGVALGAEVAATAGSAAKVDHCRRLGARIAVNYRDEDFVAATRPGVDVILDTVGAKYLARHLEALNPDGRIVTIGLLGGRRAELDLGTLLAKRASVAATSLRSRPLDQKARIAEQTYRNVWPMLADGRVRTVVDSTFDLAEADEALRHLESSRHVGKLILTV